MSGFIRSMSAGIARLLLGLVLTGASASKLFAFREFAVSLSQLTGVPSPVAVPAAAVLIALECGAGLMLLAGKGIRIAAPAALFLFLAFTAVLTFAIVRGVDLHCNCFGSLGPKLHLRDQAVLDLLFAATAYFLIRKTAVLPGDVRGHSPFTGVAAFSALLWGSALIVWPDPNAGGGRMNSLPAPFLGTEPDSVTGRPSVILLADFDDFSCQLCLDDFLAFCDSLNGERFRSTVSTRLVARRDSSRTGPAQARLIEGWAAGNGYRFPVSVDQDSLFERSGVGKTSAIVLGADGRLLDIAHFPTGGPKRNELLRSLGG